MEKSKSGTDGDIRVQAVVNGLLGGKSREELAVELGYANHRSMDMLMRRNNYVWDAKKNRYYQPGEIKPTAQESSQRDTKAEKVCQLFTQGLDAKKVAELAGFPDHREMANFMRGKGYVWDAEENSYGIIGKSALVPGDPSQIPTSRQCRQSRQSDGDTLADWQQYLPYLEWLQDNIELLDTLLTNSDGTATTDGNLGTDGVIPRYAVPGVFITKSVHMSNQLDQLIRDFSTERNISQRDIVAAALIEFFRKYGYRKQIDTLLSAR